MNPSYYIQGLLRQPDSATARAYLGVGAGGVVNDTDVVFTNNIIGNASAAKHGYLPLLSGIASQYLDGTGTWSDPSGGLATGFYKFSTSTVAADPGSGYLRLNAGTWAATTNAYVDQITNGGTDVTAWIAMLRTGDTIAIQDRNDSSKRGRYTVSAPPTDNTGWFTIPLTYVDGSGAVPANNQVIAVTLFFGGGGAGTGTVTNTGTLTDHGVIVGNGGVDVSALAVGLTNTLLHGNTGADPSFSAVVEADITLSNNTTNNVDDTKHGFCPKSTAAGSNEYLQGGAFPGWDRVTDADLLMNASPATDNDVTIAAHGFCPVAPNDVTKYLDGTGAWSVPAGGTGLTAAKVGARTIGSL